MTTKTNDIFYDFEEIMSDVHDVKINDYFYLKNLEQRKIFFTGEVNMYSVKDVISHIIQFNREDDEANIAIEDRVPIKLYISSEGGDVESGFGLINIILASQTPVITINLSYQYSMGFLVGLAGHVRYAVPNAIFLMHDGVTYINDSDSKVQDRAEFNKAINERIKRYVLSRSDLTSEEYDSKRRVEWYMYADEAKEHGFVDYIIGEDINPEDGDTIDIRYII